MTRKLDTLHRILRLDSDHAGALRVAFAAAAGAFGADAPEFFSRLARADLAAVSPCPIEQLAAAANAEVTTLDLADTERYPAGAGRPARARIGVHEEVTVLRDGYPVRWAVAGEPLAAGESLGCSTRGVLSFGTGHSGVRLVEQVADSREASTVGGTGEYLDFGYWQIDRELDPFTSAPRMNDVEGKDHLASARTRLEAARDALDALEPDGRRKIVCEIFDLIGVSELSNRYLPRDLRGRAEDAGLIQRVEGPCDYDWSIASEELVILGAATPAVVAEAKRILAGTVRAVRMHGHGQGQVAQPDTAARVPMEAPIGPGPRVEIVRRGG